MCKLSTGRFCNVEVQKADDDDHFRRVRYHASCITANKTPASVKFEDVPDLCVVYITDFDILNKGRTIYHVNSFDRETHTLIEDGLSCVYVNTKINDHTKIARLMKCLLQTEVHDNEFPKLTNGVNYLKNSKEGVNTMCQVWEKYNEEIRAEGKAEGKAEGIIKMGRNFNLSDESIIKTIMEETRYTMEESKKFLLKYDTESL